MFGVKNTLLAPPSYGIRHETKRRIEMQTVLVILFFCGIGCLLDRLLCGFLKKLSNSNKMRNE